MPLIKASLQSKYNNMINTRISQLNTLHLAIQYPLIKTLQSCHTRLNYSDQYCSCLVSTDCKIKGQFIIIQLLCKPNASMFQGIYFSIKMLLNCVHPHSQPIVYNDRRVFHPNINLMNCQIISKVIKSELKSFDILNSQFSVFERFIKHVMQIIVSPDCSFVADNSYNRKAAWHYTYNRANYKNLILQNCPANLNKAIIGHYRDNLILELNKKSSIDYNEKSQSFWSIECTVPKQKNIHVTQSYTNDFDDFAQRKIKVMREDCCSDNLTQINEISEYEAIQK